MEHSILTKKPWSRRLTEGTLPHSALHFSLGEEMGARVITYTQRRMLDEYYPTSHDIYNKALYPDIVREVDEVVVEDGVEVVKPKKYVEPIPRTAFSYQQLIETKRTDHLCGNDVTFERNWVKGNETMEKAYQEIVDGWENYDMEDAIYQLVHQSNIVGDAAVVFYVEQITDKKKALGWNAYSYFNGDEIFAHRDQKTGKVILFARKFTNDYGDEIVEVWDDKSYYVFEAPKEGETQKADRYDFGNGFYLDSYIFKSKGNHSFNVCPVVYRRLKDGPVWVFSQDSIEAYEEDFNGMRHNNKTYGEPIMVMAGDDVEGTPELDGTIKYINAGKDDKVSMLQGQSAAESYVMALDKLEDLIYLQSFIVKTPELKSGDLPAAALKILYSPAVEKAMHEVKDIQPVVNAMVDLFRWGLGLVNMNTIDYQSNNLPIKAYLKPFVHQSESAMVADINASVAAGVLSKRSGAERLSGYLAEENEYERIVAEQKEEQQADLLYEQSLAASTKQPNPTGE